MADQPEIGSFPPHRANGETRVFDALQNPAGETPLHGVGLDDR